MPTKYPLFPKGEIDVPGNDSRHNLPDPNRGGSPIGGQGVKRVPIGQRGGFQHQGRDKVAVRAQMSGARSGSGNPASRGGTPGSFRPDTRVSGHGGSPQAADALGGNLGLRGGSLSHGQEGVPGGHQTGVPAKLQQAGNTSGLAYRRIAGRFKRAAMGAKATSSDSGKYGSPPVTANT